MHEKAQIAQIFTSAQEHVFVIDTNIANSVQIFTQKTQSYEKNSYDTPNLNEPLNHRDTLRDLIKN